MVYGGESEARIPFDPELNKIYKTDLLGWTAQKCKGDLKPPMRIASAQVFNKGDGVVPEFPSLYMFGGRLGPDGDKEQPLDDLWKFTPERTN